MTGRVDPEWFSGLEPGWQQKWLINFATLQTGGFADEDLVKDGWTDISQRIRDHILADPENAMNPETWARAYEDSDDEKMAEIRHRVDEVVADPEVAEALKPWYRQLCKRPCFHDEYLQAYNNPHTHLVDTDGKGVERIDETGLWANGEHYELDCIIFASGFEVGTTYARRSGYDAVGRDGLTLSEAWQDGMRSLHGMHVHGFPNLFVIGFAQAANLVSNVPHNLVEAGETMAAVVRHAIDDSAEEVEVTEQAEADWIAVLQGGVRRIGNDPNCTPGYYNNEGQLADAAAIQSSLGYPAGPVAYFQYIDEWRTNGRFDGLEFRRA